MRLLTDGMKFITAKELKDYRCVLAVPGYQVWEHPTTFHTYVIHKKYKSSTDKFLVVVEGVWPGLAHDPPVTVPAGMWREMRKLIVKQSPPPVEDRVQQGHPRLHFNLPEDVAFPYGGQQMFVDRPLGPRAAREEE
jgi:hypothetical protein